MRGKTARAFMLLIVFFGATGRAHSEGRIALLIGNEEYSPTIGALSNPSNDVARLGAALRKIGFEVTIVNNAGFAQLNGVLSAHARKLSAAGQGAIGFFYYSGHGALNKENGVNYLIPTDVKTADAELWDYSVPLRSITDTMRDRAPNATHFVVFDACRNSLRLKETGSKALVQSKGFEPLRTVSGMLVAYATAEGETASDVGSGAGPYSTALAEEIVKPGVEAVTMFRNVQLRVRAAINQEPWLSYGALNEVWFAGREEKTTIPAPPTPPAPARESEAAEAWDRAKDATSAAVLEAFIARYKDTFYAELARARVQDMKRQLSASPAPRLEQFATAAPLPPPPPSSARDWVDLGCQTVSFRVDRDVLRVGRRDGRYGAIRLHVRGGDAEMLDLRVIYTNGEPDNIQVRRILRRGDRTNPLDLRGGERLIDRIEMVYRAVPNFRGREAVVCVEGLQLATAAPPPPPPPSAGAWVELGCKQVALFGRDRDAVPIGRQESHSKAIRLHVRGADVEMLDLKVTYANGEPDDIPVRHLIRQGERTRPLDLRGWERSINRVDIVYQTIPNFKGLARVCVEGLQ